VTYSSLSRADRSAERRDAPLPRLPETSVTFPGIPAVISAVRWVVADAMDGSPRADDLVLIACEYATNAICHSPSGLPGGEFMVRVSVKPGWARLEVSDQGTGGWVATPRAPDGDGGRGLVIAAAFADVSGHEGCCAWAEVTWATTST
jgi:hypothetical protein